MFKLIKSVILIFISVVSVMTILFYAVVQESLRLNPPTAEEVASNPELAEYLP